MERLSIQGDFFDCQLYNSRLYLWTFNGSLQVYDYDMIMSWWEREKLNRPKVSVIRRYEYEPSSFMLETRELRSFLIYERGYLTSEFPTDTEFYEKQLYETNSEGLFVTGIHKHSKVKQLWDCPLLSINAYYTKKIVCAAGIEGLFEFSSTIDSMTNLTNNHAIDADFCNPGIYVQSYQNNSYLLLNDNDGRIVNDYDLFPKDKEENISPSLAWCWKDNFFLAKNHVLQKFKYLYNEHRLFLVDCIKFYDWKGDFISAGSIDYGTMIELENAAFVIEGLGTKNNHATIEGSVTRWRFYPRLHKYKNHLHIIFDDRLDVLIMSNNFL